jgi:integrase
MGRIRKYDSRCDDLLLEDITADWLARYDAWLSLTMRSANSRSIHLRNLRAVFNDAITRELTQNYPFRRFKIRSQPTRHRALTAEQLRELLATECMPHEKRYLDMFLLMFLLCGISPVDLFKLERMSHGRVVFRRSKTAQPVDIRVEPEALDIITRYRGENQLINILDNYQDYDDFLKKMNRALKTLGGVGHEERVTKDGKVRLVAVRRKTWPDLSAYWARHTWASIARSLGVPMDVIAQAMGHSLHSVTDIYIARDSSLVDEANRKVIDWVLYGRR